MLEGHCADVGRNPADIEKSLLVRFDPDDMADLERQLRSLADLGADTAIINFPMGPHRVELVDQIAEVVAAVE